MSIALFALAVVMIVGGIASVAQGFPFVRLESGLSMVIAGATTASAGAILLGVATVAHRLRGIARILDTAPRRDTPTRGEVPSREPIPFREEEPILPPVETGPGATPLHTRPTIAAGAGLTAGAGLGLGSGLATGAAVSRKGTQPTFVEPAAPEETEPLLPDLLPEPSPAAEAATNRQGPVAAPSSDASQREPGQAVQKPLSFPAPEPAAPEEAHLPLVLRPSLAEEPETASEAPAEPVLPPAPEALEVVGTYASGGNSYVMFSNGAIEAETPRGRYTFSSLDELKAFVEAGGEGEARGAA